MTVPDQPPLRLLHSTSLLKTDSLLFWSGKTSAEVIASLEMGRERLAVSPDGTVLNGNHRIHILRQRAFPVDSLPRPIYRRMEFQ